MTDRLWKAIRRQASVLRQRLRGAAAAQGDAAAVERREGADAADADLLPGAADDPAGGTPGEPGRRTFVVGDVHGHLQKLDALLAILRAEAAPGDALVFVGDYVDRGPDSRGVIDLVLRAGAGEWDGPVFNLRGNHEELMLDFADGAGEFEPEIWLQNGGVETLVSYGGDPASDLLDLLPEPHLEFLRQLLSWHEDENGIYVHAGLLPGESPEESPDAVRLWIREPFIESEYQWEKVVVFGHTPQFEEPKKLFARREDLKWRPLLRPEKIGIDTGAAYGGPLTAVLLPDRTFFSVP